MCGMILEGIFAGGTPNYTKEGKENGFVYLLVDGGSNSWRIQSDDNILGKVSFGDVVKFSIRVRVWNNAVYFHGDVINEN